MSPVVIKTQSTSETTLLFSVAVLSSFHVLPRPRTTKRPSATNTKTNNKSCLAEDQQRTTNRTPCPSTKGSRHTTKPNCIPKGQARTAKGRRLTTKRNCIPKGQESTTGLTAQKTTQHVHQSTSTITLEPMAPPPPWLATGVSILLRSTVERSVGLCFSTGYPCGMFLPMGYLCGMFLPVPTNVLRRVVSS